MKKLFVRIGKNPTAPMTAMKSALVDVTSSNAGNMLFQQSVWKALSTPTQNLFAIGNDLHEDHADIINSQADMLVLPLANQFRLRFAQRLKTWTRLIKKLNIPVVVVGVGCQTDKNFQFDNLRPMDDIVKDFVGAVLDHSASIGVRGECTQEYLRHLGFSNVEVIGCPSMFMYGRRLPLPRAVEIDRASRLSVNVSSPGTQAEFSSGLESAGQYLGNIIVNYDDVDYISQESRSLEDLLFGWTRSEIEHECIPPQAFAKVHENAKAWGFVDPISWFRHLRARDFCVGTRLHGTIAAILAGTPAHMIVHDSRTLELASYFSIPHTRVEDINSEKPLDDLYEETDCDAMLRGHDERFNRYKTFLARNGMDNIFDHPGLSEAYDQRMEKIDFAPGVSSGKSRPGSQRSLRGGHVNHFLFRAYRRVDRCRQSLPRQMSIRR